MIVKGYLEGQFESFNSRNKLEVNVLGTGEPWISDAVHWNYEAGRAATKVNNESLDVPRILLSIHSFIGNIRRRTGIDSRGRLYPCHTHIRRNFEDC